MTDVIPLQTEVSLIRDATDKHDWHISLHLELTFLRSVLTSSEPHAI